MASFTDFENIYREMRLAPNGLGWKPINSASVVTVSKDEIKWAQWIKVARNYQLRIGLNRDRSDIKIGDRRRTSFDGFRFEDRDQLVNLFKQHYNVTLETKDMSLRGWNWGKVDVQASDLAFMVASKPAFELPLAYVHNATINKTEVAIEFLDPAALQPKPDGPSHSNKPSGRKGITDQLVELRLYVPGNASPNNAAGSNAESDVDDAGDGDGTTAAQVLHDLIMEKAEVGRVQGEGIVTFDDVLCTTPRGRYDIDMYSDFLRLRGKTYDYKVLYSSILRLFLLPKPDEIHFNFVVQLDPPIRQGQTRYPFLVMQFANDEEMDAVLNLDPETLMSIFQQEHNKVEGQVHEVVSIIFKGLAKKKIIFPQGFTSVGGQTAIKCSVKTNEGLVYFLDKYVLFISKQPVLVALADLHSVKFARVGGALQSGRTFDLVLKKKDDADLQLSSLSREEHTVIDEYFKSKGKKVLNEMNEDVMGAAAALSDDEDEQMDDPSDEDVRSRDRKASRGEANDDSESDDEDFKLEEEDSDVGEEYDSNYEDSDSDEDEEEETPLKKKKLAEDGDEPPAKKQKK